MGPERFKPFDLQSISAGIRRIKNRIATLEQAAQEETKEIEFSDGIILDNVEENRVQIIFNSIPSQETREQLKKNGFRWSRRNRAWQRHRSDIAFHLAKKIVGVES